LHQSKNDYQASHLATGDVGGGIFLERYYYSEEEWARLCCGPLPEKRRHDGFQQDHAKGNTVVDNNSVKGYR
jgi:hypothetical protein